MTALVIAAMGTAPASARQSDPNEPLVDMARQVHELPAIDGTAEQVYLDFNAPLDRIVAALLRTSSYQWPYGAFDGLIKKHSRTKLRAAIAERLRTGRGFDGISDERIAACFLELRDTRIDDHAKLPTLQDAVEAEAKSRGLVAPTLAISTPETSSCGRRAAETPEDGRHGRSRNVSFVAVKVAGCLRWIRPARGRSPPFDQGSRPWCPGTPDRTARHGYTQGKIAAPRGGAGPRI